MQATTLPPDHVRVPEDFVDDAAEAAGELLEFFHCKTPPITKDEVGEHMATIKAAIKAAGCKELALRTAGKSLTGAGAARQQRSLWIYDALEHANNMEGDEGDALMEFGHAATLAMLVAEPDIFDFFFEGRKA